jgi:putative cell wall-binding protein
VALARADAPPDNPTASWADAVSAGGYAAEADTPVLLTQTAALAPAVAAYLDEVDPDGVVLLGGEAALSAAVAEAVPGARRIQGPNRYATAGAIATDLWPQPTSGYLVTAGNHLEGWAYALAGAGLAADTNSPILLVETAQLPPETRGLSCRGGTPPPMTVIGGDPVVSPTVRDALGQPC